MMRSLSVPVGACDLHCSMSLRSQSKSSINLIAEIDFFSRTDSLLFGLRNGRVLINLATGFASNDGGAHEL